MTTELDVVANDGLLSLREAIALANSNADADVITFAANLAGKTITLGSELAITADITIDGDVNGDNKADITISGNSATRIFNISGGDTDVDLLSLTLTGGNSKGSAGGAILGNGISTLDLVDTTISNSMARIGGGGVFVDGGAVTGTRVLFSGNTAFDMVGGLAGIGGGGFGGGIAVNNGSLALTNATVHGNTASLSGGGISVFNAALNLLNSTVTDNNVTPNAPFTGVGAGISGADASTSIVNSVVAGNVGGTYGTPNDVSGTVGTASNSVFGSDVAGVTGGSNGNLENITGLGLGALQDNGGTVMTRNILSAGSLLINGGSNAAAAGLATDANGDARIFGGTVDIGATEFDDALIVTTELDVVDVNDGFLSLREALTLANGTAEADRIIFASSLAGKTIVLTSQLQITSDVTIDGDVNGDFKADVTLSGNNANGILRATGFGTGLSVRSLTLSNGAATYGGAIYAGGNTTLQVSHSTLSNSSGSSFGGGIFTFGNTYITNSAFFGNSAGNGGGGGIYSRYGYVVLMNTTVHGNSTTGLGGGVKSGLGDLLLINSTVTGNQADSDGAQVNAGGGIAVVYNALSITNSVVAENTSTTSKVANDVAGSITSALNSFFGTAVTINAGSGNINGGGDPLLGELLDNGGTVLTLSPLDGSPLIGKGSNVFLPFDVFDIDGDGDTTELLPLDGRGGVRILLGTVDIGAVEQFPAETIRGTSGNNTIIGGLGADILFGLGGGDTITGGAANDYVEGGAGADTMDGGAGNGDMLSYAGSAQGVTVSMLTGFAAGGDAAGDTFANFENLTGSNRADTLTGNAGNNLIQGLNGTDVIDGGDGDDTIIGGGGGGDTLTGGAGIDTLSYVGSAGVTINLATGEASGGHATGDIISGFENINGSNGKDTLTGNAQANLIRGNDGADVIRGGAGADNLNGGKGFDTLSYAGSSLGVTINLATNTASGGDATGDVIFGFENLLGSGQADTLIGSNTANTINGGGGADRIDGGGRVDTIAGGAGADTFVLAFLKANRDIFTDFGLGADKLEINAAIFGGGLVAGALDPNAFVLGTAAIGLEDRFIYDGATGQLFYDSNGSNAGGSRLIATFTNLAVLNAGDFVIV